MPAVDKENKVTTLEHSLEILEQTLTYCKENNKPVIVFLNKTDLFAAKLKKVQFSSFYPDCKAGGEYLSLTRVIANFVLTSSLRHGS